eukprot:s940_g7.t1
MVSYNAVIAACAAGQHWRSGLALLRRRPGQPELAPFNALAAACCRLSPGLELLEDARRLQLQLDVLSYLALVPALRAPSRPFARRRLVAHMHDAEASMESAKSSGLGGELGAPLALAEAWAWESQLRSRAATALTRRAYVATLRLQSLLSQPTGSAGRPLHDPALAQQNSLGGPLTQQTLELFRLSTGPRGAWAWVSLARTGCRRQLQLLGLRCYGPDPGAQHLPAWGASAQCAGHVAGSRFSEDGASGPKKAASPTPLCPVYVDHDRSSHAERLLLLDLLQRAGESDGEKAFAETPSSVFRVL